MRIHLLRVTTACRLAISLLALVAAGAGAARAQVSPPGYSQQTIAVSSNPNASCSGAAAAYAPGGTLYVVQGNQNYGSPAAEIDVVNPNGSLGTPIAVSGVPAGGFYAIAGAAWDPVTGALLVTDAAPGAGAVFDQPEHRSGDHAITAATRLLPESQCAPTATSSSPTPRAERPGRSICSTPSAIRCCRSSPDCPTGAGMGFDSSGHLIYQQAILNPSDPFTTIGEVYKAPLSGSGAGTTVGPSTLLSGNTAGFGLAVAPNGDAYITGSGGLFHLDHATNAVSLFANDGLGASNSPPAFRCSPAPGRSLTFRNTTAPTSWCSRRWPCPSRRRCCWGRLPRRARWRLAGRGGSGLKVDVQSAPVHSGETARGALTRRRGWA